MLRKKVQIPVRPAAWPGQLWTVVGWFSSPGDFLPDTLLVLVHGANYTHAYWDFPYRPEIYSFVLWAHEHGIATLNIEAKVRTRPGVSSTWL